MTPTISDISEARRADIEYLVWIKEGSRAQSILVAVAEQLDLFERRWMDAKYPDLCWAEHQAVLQVWESAYQAAGGVT